MKILIAMSGGVDSSVAAGLLCRDGNECIGATMKLYHNEDAGIPRAHTCCSLDDVEDARSVRRGEKQAEFYLTPEKTETGYRLGISVRDNISGIGTITFFDPETGVYGALGHGVAGLTSAQPLAISGGVLVPSSVTDVKKGVRGTPGELHGSFDVADPLGSVSQNEPHGIFGKLTALPQSESVPVADASQIHTGAAVILANVDGKETREYCVRIDKLYPQAENGRNLLLTVTDERLLAVTGGIVQGMSGSPILQDGRLIGAVTHVLVNRPEQGYGIFLQNMLTQCEAYQ